MFFADPVIQFSPYEECLNKCSLIFGDYTWFFLIPGIIVAFLITRSIVRALDSAGNSHGLGCMSILMIIGIGATWITLLILVWVCVTFGNVDQYRCDKECSHLPRVKTK